ncbi:hypothetical protein [Gemmobacter sp. LW-1]|uniref:hypothetical protein n=1 Tax=Gemmobacter sp. LW-1 TaxID=1529005 RepID=UPI0009ECB409|nr:hypothetical protein [Gemmobacter sp. LW-1]
MNTPKWLKPGLYGALVGAAALALIGFNWGGWKTSGGAEQLAANQSSVDVTAALVPVCVERSRADPAGTSKLEALRAESSIGQPAALMKTGWATPPGKDNPDIILARACLKALAITAP